MNKFFKRSWLLICSFMIVYAFQQRISGNLEEAIVPAFIVILLAFPLGIFVPLLYTNITKFIPFSFSGDVGLVGDVLILLAMAGVGYWQWFILFPKLMKIIRNEQSLKKWGIVIAGFIIFLYGVYGFYLYVFPTYNAD